MRRCLAREEESVGTATASCARYVHHCVLCAVFFFPLSISCTLCLCVVCLCAVCCVLCPYLHESGLHRCQCAVRRIVPIFPGVQNEEKIKSKDFNDEKDYHSFHFIINVTLYYMSLKGAS